MEEEESDPYFYEQTGFRKTPKRYRKTPDDLPHDLRFAQLNPRVAAYLASKEKEKKLAEAELDTGLGNKSLLPQINQSVNLIRQRLDSCLSNDEESQRYLFEETKFNAPNVLIQLAKFLYLFEGTRTNIPKSLEYQLLCGWKELTADVHVVPREWQCLSNKEAAQSKASETPLPGVYNKTDEKDGVTPGPGATAGTSELGDELDSPKGKDGDRKKLHIPGPKMLSRGALADIAEDEEQREGRGRVDPQLVTSRTNESIASVTGPATRSRESRDRLLVPKPKTRLEKYKSLHESGSHSRASVDLRVGHASPGFSLRRPGSSMRHDDAGSVLGENMSDGSRSVLGQSGGYYMSVIQFQLSSKACEEKGWIVHPSGKEDPEQETLLEWATQRLQLAIKQQKEQTLADKQNGLDKPIVVRCYGDSRKEAMLKYGKRTAKSSSSPLYKNSLEPRVPSTDHVSAGKQLFQTSVSDGSTTIFYPSGRPAIFHTSAGLGKTGFYTIVYDDTAEQRMLACFTPAGRGCCYHSNGVVRFLATEAGGTLAESDGEITKRWNWPGNHAKLPVSIIFQLNQDITFRCATQSQIQIFFNCQKETAKFNVGHTSGAEDPRNREELGNLITGFPFMSQTAKEYSKPFKPKTVPKAKPKATFKSKEKVNRSPVQQPEIQKVLELPEPTENDAEADKQLGKLQRKIKNLVEDWMDHYRIAVGMGSPHLKSMSHSPNRKRDIQSAKSTGGEVRVIIENMNTQVPAPTISKRAQSAVPAPGRERPSSSDTSRHSSHQLASVSGVKFEDKPRELEEVYTPNKYDSKETDLASVGRSTSFVRSMTAGSAATTTRSTRTKSAPPQRFSVMSAPDRTWSPPKGTCPIALRQSMLGEERPTCKCSRHKVPHITDIEYDEFVNEQAPPHQLIIVATVSSLYPNSTPGEMMIESLHAERNKNRTRPCLQARNDSFRILLYDIAQASEFSDHSQPLLLRRHNVVPGMFLMYEGGKLLFCDHIFNGYGNAKKDFHKQMMMTRRSASAGYSLPKDFRFSPLRGRQGPRAAWGGEIGGAGVDRHGSAGLAGQQASRKTSLTSMSSTSTDAPVDYHVGYLDSAAQYISGSLSTSGFQIRAHSATSSPPSPAPVRQLSTSVRVS